MTGCFIDSGLDHGIYLNSDISQGSVVTQLRCGEIISQGFVANLLVNLSVKEVWKSVKIWRSYGQYFSALFFWLRVYMARCSTSGLPCCSEGNLLILSSIRHSGIETMTPRTWQSVEVGRDWKQASQVITVRFVVVVFLCFMCMCCFWTLDISVFSWVFSKLFVLVMRRPVVSNFTRDVVTYWFRLNCA